jgi:hypothetical protein
VVHNGKFKGQAVGFLATGISPIYPNVAGILTSYSCLEFNARSLRVVSGLCLKHKNMSQEGTLQEADVQGAALRQEGKTDGGKRGVRGGVLIRERFS